MDPTSQPAEQDTESPSIPLMRYVLENEILYRSPTPSANLSQHSSFLGAESFDWVLCYSDDIYKHWRQMEQKRMIVKCYPNMAAIRPFLISILRELQTTYGLENTTLHLSVYILDNFLSRNSENVPMKLMVITALLVATKVEDLDVKLPSFTELNQTMLNNDFTLSDYRRIEAKMLTCMDFVLTIPTVATFADYFSRVSVVLDDFYMNQQTLDNNCMQQQRQQCQTVADTRIMYVIFERYDQMLTAVNELLQRLVDYTLESTSLLNMLPSRKAAGCIAAARLLFNVQPVWTPFLEMQSFYSESEVLPIMEAIIAIYDVRISNESSYGFSTPTENHDYEGPGSSGSYSVSNIYNESPYGYSNPTQDNDDEGPGNSGSYALSNIYNETPYGYSTPTQNNHDEGPGNSGSCPLSNIYNETPYGYSTLTQNNDDEGPRSSGSNPLPNN